MRGCGMGKAMRRWQQSIVISEYHAGYLWLGAKTKETRLPFTIHLPFLRVIRSSPLRKQKNC